MSYVICDPCLDVKDKSCTEVCPMDCIQGGDNDRQMFINPDDCIDCGSCETACPVEAIYSDISVPEKWKYSIELNAAHFRD